MKKKMSNAEKRESASVLLLIIVILSLLKPVSPYISDGLAHHLWNEKHHLKMHQDGVEHIDSDLQKMNNYGDNENEKPVDAISITAPSLFFSESFAEYQYYSKSIILDMIRLNCIIIQRTLSPSIQPPDYTG